MANLLANGDFRSGSVDLKIGNGTGTVPTSTATIGSWGLNCDETDAATNKYVRVRNIKVAAAVAAGKVTEPPQEVIGDFVLLFDAEAGSLGASRVGFAEVQQSITSSPKALSNQIVELNFFVYSAVSGVFGVKIQNINVYASGTISTSILNEAVQLQVGWNRVRRVFLHPNVLDTDPTNGAYVSGSHLVLLDVDQGQFSNVNINVNTTVAITGAYFGLQLNAEFNRIEEIIRQKTIDLADASVGNGLPPGGTTGQALQKSSNADFVTTWVTPANPSAQQPTGGTAGQALRKNSSTNFDASYADVHEVPTGGTAGQALRKNSSTNFDASFAAVHEVPAGGTTGQVLEKNSNTDYDASWTTPATPPGLLPTGGTVGQVLKKNSSTNYDASFAGVLGTNVEGTTTGTITLNMTPGQEIDWVVLTGNPTFATSNLIAGAFKSIRIDSNGSSRSLSFPGSWLWLGTNYSAGFTLASGSAVLSLTSYGTTDAGVIACLVPTA